MVEAGRFVGGWKAAGTAFFAGEADDGSKLLHHSSSTNGDSLRTMKRGSKSFCRKLMARRERVKDRRRSWEKSWEKIVGELLG